MEAKESGEARNLEESGRFERVCEALIGDGMVYYPSVMGMKFGGTDVWRYINTLVAQGINHRGDLRSAQAEAIGLSSPPTARLKMSLLEFVVRLAVYKPEKVREGNLLHSLAHLLNRGATFSLEDVQEAMKIGVDLVGIWGKSVECEVMTRPLNELMAKLTTGTATEQTTENKLVTPEQAKAILYGYFVHAPLGLFFPEVLSNELFEKIPDSMPLFLEALKKRKDLKEQEINMLTAERDLLTSKLAMKVEEKAVSEVNATSQKLQTLKTQKADEDDKLPFIVAEGEIKVFYNKLVGLEHKLFGLLEAKGVKQEEANKILAEIQETETALKKVEEEKVRADKDFETATSQQTTDTSIIQSKASVVQSLKSDIATKQQLIAQKKSLVIEKEKEIAEVVQIIYGDATTKALEAAKEYNEAVKKRQVLKAFGLQEHKSNEHIDQHNNTSNDLRKFLSCRKFDNGVLGQFIIAGLSKANPVRVEEILRKGVGLDSVRSTYTKQTALHIIVGQYEKEWNHTVPFVILHINPQHLFIIDNSKETPTNNSKKLRGTLFGEYIKEFEKLYSKKEGYKSVV